MDDTSNLAWKLAGIIHGWGGKGLLKFYEQERGPVAERNTIAARDLNVHLSNLRCPLPLSRTPARRSRAAECARANLDFERNSHDRRAARRAL
jgi:hypothetical protein